VIKATAAAASAALVLVACGGSPAAPSDGLVDIGAGLRGPRGLVATVHATGLTAVAAMAFDAQGRLWVATADYTDAGKDGVYVVARSSAVPVQVLSGVHTPLGLLWADGTLYVASAGRVDAYGRFDGSRFASHETIVTLSTGVGQPNGMVLSPDGRLLMGISAPCDHCRPTSPWSASIVSFRTDGRDLRVYAGGIRAPIGLAYFPGTSDLYVTMNQRDDLGEATPGDWLALVRQGQRWGFPDCYGQGGTTCAGVPTPTAVLDKHAAVSGVAMVSGALAAGAATAAVVAEWSTGVVQRVALTRMGTAYQSAVRPYLTGVQNPVAVVLGPDGGLYVGDWASGTVYRIAG
jgi:glucose/arabinose dehydrogenase